MKSKPDDHRIKDFLKKATDCLAKDEYNKAIKILRRALKIAPDDSRAYNNIGVAYDKKKDAGKAIEYYHKALECNPRDVAVNRNLGLAYGRQGKWDKARKYYEAVVGLHPGDRDAYYHAGRACYLTGDYTAATEYFQKAILLDPEHVASHISLGTLYSLQGRTNEALAYLDAGKVLTQKKSLSMPAVEESQEGKKDQLRRDIGEIEWSQRVLNCFRKAGIRTFKDLVCKTERDLMRLRGFGKLCLKEINEKLKSVGLSLRKE